MSGAYRAVLSRRSWSSVTDAAPSEEELRRLVGAAGRVADHSSLRPWRLIELRGDDRIALGRAINETIGEDGYSTKPLRAPLLIAVVASFRPSEKVPRWEQEAVAAGVAHTLSLLLDEAGWGVIWRTGHYTRSSAVARAHGLGADEDLLGWLYVGGKPSRSHESGRRPVDADAVLSRMPDATDAPSETPKPAAPKDAKKKSCDKKRDKKKSCDKKKKRGKKRKR